MNCLPPNIGKSQHKLSKLIDKSVSTTSLTEISIETLSKTCETQNNCKPKPLVQKYSWISTNQNATTQSASLADPTILDSDSSNPKPDHLDQHSSNKTSLILIRNNQNKLFKLTFRAVDSYFVPLFTKQRIFIDKENDKKSQPNSQAVFIEEYTPHLIRSNTTRKSFHLLYRDQASKSSDKRKQYGHEPPPPKPVKRVSTNKKNLQKPVLFIKVQNINFKLSPKVMSLDFSKPLTDCLTNSFVQEMGLETTEQKKNKGSFIAKCRGDLLKFSFSLVDINYQQILELISRSSQIADTSVYIRKISSVNDKLVQVPLPRSIYAYRDPMVNIKQKNDYCKMHHIEPRWLTETRRNRIAAIRQCQQTDSLQKIYDATNGSNIIFEGPRTINKAREGCIQCYLSPDDIEKYEKWIIHLQKDGATTVTPEGDYLETHDTTNSNEVPDWDMTIYMK